MGSAARLASCLLLAAFACSAGPLATLAQRPSTVPTCGANNQSPVYPGVAGEYSASFGGRLFPSPDYVLDVGCSNYAQDWNIAMQWSIRNASTQGYGPRMFALLHLAQWQALQLNSASGSRINDNFLVAFVSHYILLSLQPQYAARYDALLARQTAGFAATELALASAAGNAVAAALLAARAGDGSAAASLYQPAPPGGPEGVFEAIVWPGTPPAPYYAQFANASGFIVPRNTSQVGLSSPPPAAPGSAEYRAQLQAVKLQGSNDSVVRSPDQTETAIWWYESTNTSGCVGHWNQVVLATMQPGMPLQQSVQLLAQINVANFDAFVVVFREKYRFNRWGAVTAIRRGDCVPGKATLNCMPPEPDWTPLLRAPNAPSYPGWHGACGGPATVMLTQLHGPGHTFTIGTEASRAGRLLPARVFGSLEQACLEDIDARIWAGFGTPIEGLVGLNLSRAVTTYVLERFSQLDPTSPDVAPEYAGMAAAFQRALNSTGGN